MVEDFGDLQVGIVLARLLLEFFEELCGLLEGGGGLVGVDLLVPGEGEDGEGIKFPAPVLTLQAEGPPCSEQNSVRCYRSDGPAPCLRVSDD